MSGTIDIFDAVTIAVVAVVAWVVLSRLYRRKSVPPALSKPEIEQRFRTVFGLTPVERREALISHNMTKHHCSRHEAMNIAMEERQADEDRW